MITKNSIQWNKKLNLPLNHYAMLIFLSLMDESTLLNLFPSIEVLQGRISQEKHLLGQR